MNRPRTALLLSATVLICITFNLCKWRNSNMLGYDTAYYYLYLPAKFIYNDLGKLAFYPTIINKYSISGRNHAYELYPQAETGRLLNKYAVGVSICEFPLFLIAHWYSSVTGNYDADGYSTPYRISIVFSVLLWVMTGLYFLMKFLSLYFNDTITAVTLILILFGTNLYFYTVMTIGMSHPFSFALFCILLYLTNRAYVTGHSRFIVLTGLVLGLITILRPTNLLVALIPILWPYSPNEDYPNKVTFLRQKAPALALGLALFFSVVLIQFSYIKYMSGSWLHFSYEEEGFNFLSPQIINGLFSYRKGWFIYTPLALAAVIGLIPLAKIYRKLALLISVYLGLTVYLVFSWHAWSYGGSFGCRPMIESLAILALPLGALLQEAFRRFGKPAKIGISALISACVVLNVFQSYQIMYSIIPWDNNNKAYYWRTFGKLKVTEADKRLLE